VARRQQSLAARLAILSVFYLVQGLPFGFQAKALPVYLTSHGLSLTEVGFAGAVSAPWLLKPLWAPFVDRYASERFGRRRSWIVPLQAALASTCLGLAFVPPEALLWFLGLVTLTNLFAATMDIAVDGLAVDMLEPHELGWGNIAQVVAYKIGMVIGGGILLWASQWIGWRGLFQGISALIFVAWLITLLWREPKFDDDEAQQQEPAIRTDLRALLRTLGRALISPGGRTLLLVVATYKIGESISDGMFEPFLVRYAKWTEARIGLVVGVHCMWFSLAGSFLGGALVARWGAYRVMVGFAIARTLAISGVVALARLDPGSIGNADVLIAKGLEELTGGGLTTAMFAFMMGLVDRRIGATHYTLLAGVEVLGKAPGGLLSGVLADAVGFAWTFATGLGISLLCLPLLALVRPRPPRPPNQIEA
jgi:MFS transporter, PAT family, beta-lactamase induction signal transducer AmpG